MNRKMYAACVAQAVTQHTGRPTTFDEVQPITDDVWNLVQAHATSEEHAKQSLIDGAASVVRNVRRMLG